VTRSPGTGPAGAGLLLISTIIVCAGAGLGIGALVGAPVPLAFVGGALGVAMGFWYVYSRFKDI
jgi:hypothetical protein